MASTIELSIVDKHVDKELLDTASYENNRKYYMLTSQRHDTK